MNETKEITNRCEIAFFYDIRDCNPNGDPLADNRPRMDEETGICFVTDVRLKRTIRDYLRDFEEQTIFIDQFEKDDGTIKMAHERAKEFGKAGTNEEDEIKNAILNTCIDIRLFGCAIPLGPGKKSIQITGPIQFNYGKSIHRVEPVFLQGTAAFASKTGAKQRSFREDYILHYGLFKFYGIINEKLGELSDLKQDDIKLLMKAIWHGTNSLQSRSKIGHLSRLLITVEYKNPMFFLGQIDNLIKVAKKEPNKDDIALRDISEFIFDLGNLKDIVETKKDKIARIQIKAHPDVTFADEENLDTLITNWQKQGLSVEKFAF